MLATKKTIRKAKKTAFHKVAIHSQFQKDGAMMLKINARHAMDANGVIHRIADAVEVTV